MGIEDRDYYRQDYARKNGMRYNERNATYSASEKATHRDFVLPEQKPFEWHWSLVLVICLLMAVVAAAIVHYFPPAPF
ncbi:hypothetical protein [Acidovorax sp. SUPP2539]|uniref:hypothetical protein n=1 Tax=Acidovorax sp. SUPP2539 TaxID=2920878 RepID=UPI0023DE2C20|nr:hypothetical protein [Acidovorax sp. SUPP2539]GKS89108.1 hypothetical protein AVTE2539_07105 [Acidovorax sp. SUPP2539]